MGSDARWPLVVNLANSIVGVSVLAMPFCMRECGILLGSLLLLASSVLTRITSHLLIKGANIARRRSYEHYASTVLGSWGKTLIEVMMVLFLLSTLCAFNVVVGDLGPSIVANLLGFEHESPRLRVFVMTTICIFVIVPLSLLRRPESLSTISNLAILFYGVFVLRMLLLSVPFLVHPSSWIEEVSWWRPGGVLACLPILTLSLSCQTQLFVTADSMVDPVPTAIDAVVSGAVNLCTSLYFSVGLLGYVCFHARDELGGDVLVLFEPTPLTQVLKLGFTLSVAVSFPLMLFPCRLAVYTLLLAPPRPSELAQDLPIPERPFQLLTLILVGFSLVVGITIPNVEFVLGLTGAVIGMPVCVILPAVLFLYVAPDHQFYSRVSAQVCVVVGTLMMIVCTYATLHGVPPPPPQILTPVASLPPPSNFSNIPKGLLYVGGPVVVKAEKEEGLPVPVDKLPKAVKEEGKEAKRAEPPVPNERPGGVGNEPAQPIEQRPPVVASDKGSEVGKEKVEKLTTQPPLPEKPKEDAAAIIKELKEVRKEQAALIKEQKEILQDLRDVKDGKEDARPPRDAPPANPTRLPPPPPFSPPPSTPPPNAQPLPKDPNLDIDRL